MAALVVRALLVARLPAPPSWDGAIYARLAEHLARGDGFVHWDALSPPWRATAFFPVGYPAALAPLLRLTGSAMTSAHLLNVLAGTVAAACAAVLGFRVAQVRGAYLAGLAYAFAPGAALWTTAAMTETLTGALLTASVTAALWPVSSLRGRVRVSLLAGVLLGMGTLVRPQVLLAAPWLGALPPGSRSTRLLAAIVCVLGTLAVVLPWTARNCVALGACALVSTNGGSNLLIGTLPEVRGGYRPLTDADGCTGVRGEVPRDRCMTDEARTRVLQHPLRWLELGAIKLYKTFAFEWAPVSYVRSALPETFPGPSAWRAAAVCTVGWWALVLAAIAGGARVWRGGGSGQALVRIVVLNVLLFALTHAVFIGDDRYHLPLVALLTPLAAGLLRPFRPREAEPGLVWAS
jgi:4-amino-4-deoxy-L-arabinose transferase-like glycosyltransferase